MSFPLLLQEVNTQETSRMKISQAPTQTCCAAGHERAAHQVLMGQMENQPEIALKYPQYHYDKCCFPDKMLLLKTD